MAVIIKSQEEIELMREAGRLLAITHKELKKIIKPGITTMDIDKKGEEIIRSFGCIPSFLNYNGYPASICVSVNDEVVHGIPSKERYLEDGDIVSLDAGLIYKGFHSDAARTHGVGEISEEAEKLIRVTRECFFEGIKNAMPGKYLVDIARGIQKHAESNGFSVVRDLCGHGIGRNLHEDPQILNYVTFRKGTKLKEGMALAIEPMINEGDYHVAWLDDDWTVVTADYSLSAHYENTVIITKDGCEILTLEE